MKTSTVLLALDALKQARVALRVGGYEISEQMRIGHLCATAHIELEHELVEEFPELKALEAA